jgi:hypothetical protein
VHSGERTERSRKYNLSLFCIEFPRLAEFGAITSVGAGCSNSLTLITHPTAFTQYRQVKAVIDNYDASSLASFLESIGHFLSRHEVCTEMPPTVTANETVVKFPVELLSTLAFATKQIKQENVVSPSLV